MPVLAGLVSACGGGSSDGPINFTSFNEVPDDGVTRIAGSAKSASYTFDQAAGIVNVSSISSDADAFADVTYEDGEVKRVRIADTGASIDLDEVDGAVFVDQGLFVTGVSADGEDILIFVDNVDADFMYQTLGLWVTGHDTGAGTLGAGSFGAATAAANLPTSGSSVYFGSAVGFVTDGTEYFSTEADAEITAFFDTSTAAVSISNTQVFDFGTGERLGSGGSFNLSGGGPITGSKFTATVSGPRTTGDAEGQFYGPGGQEVGGTFSAAGGSFRHIGSFGAHQ